MDNKIIISKSKLIKSLNFSESNRLILGTSGEGQPIHWKREMIMDEFANGVTRSTPKTVGITDKSVA